MGIGGIVLFNHLRTFAAAALTRTDRLVAYETLKSDKRGDANDYPVVGFIDSNGIKRRFTASIGSNQKPYNLGAEVTVMFDPKDSESMDIESKLYQWMIPALVCGLSVSSLAVGIAIWLLQTPAWPCFVGTKNRLSS
jgi:hypothetical protein